MILNYMYKMLESGNQIKIGDKEYKLSDFDTHKNEIIKELKKRRI